MPTKVYDAIVVGSGITGGWATKELSEKGLETLVLEAGRPVNPDTEYVEHVPVWEKRFRGLGDRKRFNDYQPIQQTCSGVDEWNCKFFVNDRENPYTTDPDKPFLWIRGRHVGGRSIMWGRQSYRWSDLDFKANLREGIAIDGRFAIRTLRRGTTMSRISSESPVRWRDCPSFPMENFCRPWR